MQKRAKRDPYGLVGTILGRYQIRELIGIGGMGAVYSAQHSVTNANVALKVLKPDLAIANPEMVPYFIEEAQKIANLNHPFIIKVTDADIAPENIAFLVMEWLIGHTLEDELKEHGVMPLDQVTVLVEQICEALAHAHTKGIVHRDLKPGNIMIVADHKGDRVVKILDFGIAKALNSTVGANSRVMGAPYYASPEQLILGARIDHRSDIYSIGVMIHQLLTGRLPFDSDSIDRMIHQHLSITPPPLRQVRSDIPEAVEEAVLKALAKRPQDRYQSVVELSRAFRRATSVEAGSLWLQCVDAQTGSSVRGATVYLNGKYNGKVDDKGRWRTGELVPREHLVEINCDQYLHWEKHVRIIPREEVSITAELPPRELGDLVIKTTLPGAAVFLHGEQVGTTDEAGLLYLRDLTPGYAVVEVRHPKHEPASSEVEIVQGQQMHLDLELQPLPQRHRIKEALQKLSLTLGTSFDGLSRALPRGLLVAVAAGVLLLIGGMAAWRIYLFIQEAFAPKPVLIVQSNPAGGQVFVDGRSRGTTDEAGRITIPDVEKGRHLVKVLMDGYKPQEQQIDLTSSQLELSFALAPDAPPVTLVEIPGGTFMMGRNDGTPREAPAHAVTVAAFAMDKTEVTNAEYAEFVQATSHEPPPEWMGGKPPEGQENWPVANVSLADANTFAQWRSKRDGVTYRLPTEDEWEYAARGGTNQWLYPWGNEWSDDRANRGSGNTNEDRLMPVGSYPQGASPWGGLDLIGNVWEWTSSKASIYPNNTTAPPVTPAESEKFIIRGGCYTYVDSPEQGKKITSTWRYWIPPSIKVPTLGFRLVRSTS